MICDTYDQGLVDSILRTDRPHKIRFPDACRLLLGLYIGPKKQKGELSITNYEADAGSIALYTAFVLEAEI